MKKTNKLLSALLAVAMTAGQAAALTSAETNDYFSKDEAIDVAVFGGSIVGSAGNSNWSNIVADYIGKNYNGGKGANITKYNCGGVGSTVGLSRMAQLVNTTGKESTFAPDVVIIEYAVNDQQYDFTVNNSSDVTASTEVKYENGKLNIYNEVTNTYEFDYVNTTNNTTYPTGHYTAKVNETNLLASTKRIEEMVRLAQSLENKPAIFLVNVGLGLTLGDGHSIRPSFPGFMNSMATEYDKIAERLGIGYIDVEKSVWEYIENQIAAGINAGTYSDRASALDAIQWELYGDESNIHPTEKGCEIYADIINSEIDANPEKYLTAKSEITGYTDTTAYSKNSHFIPYTAGTYAGEGWSVTALPTSNNEVFNYAMSTSTTGDSVSFDFNGSGLLVYTTGGSYSYKIEDKTDNTNTVIYESSGGAKGIYCFDDATTFDKKTLSSDGSYRITLTKSSDDTTALNVVGVMVNMEMGNYLTFTEFNAAKYIPYSQQYFDFTNKDTAQDDSIETYFADMTDIAYNEGKAVIERVEDRGALKVTASQTDVNLLTITPNNVGTSVLNIEFDLKINTNKLNQQNLNLAVGTSSSLINVFRVLQNNLASPCINTGSNRYSTSVDNWWEAKCNDNNYHNIRLRLIPQSTGGRSVELYIDGNKGDTVFSANNLTNIETIQFNNATTNTQSVECEFYLDDIRIYDEVTRVQNLISAIGNVTLMSEKAINEARNAADEINEYMGSYNPIANYSTLTAAEKTLEELKQAVEAVTLAPSAVNVPVVGVNQVFDYSGLTVEKVYVNGTEISDAKTKDDARLLIPASHFTEAGKYSITITGAGLEKLYEYTIEDAQKIIYHDDATVTKTAPTGYSWGTIDATHGSRSESNVSPANLPVNSDNIETLKTGAALRFSSMPQGTYKLYFYNLNQAIAHRFIPMDAEIKSKDGSSKVRITGKGERGYTQVSDNAYTFNEESYFELTIADDATYSGSDGLFAVDSIMLERVVDTDLINTYFETGKTELTFKKAAVNSDYVGYDMAFDYDSSITISSVTVNDKALDATAYSAKSGRLFIDSSAFRTGDNTVTILDGAVSVSCTVTLQAAEAVKYYANTHSGIVKEGTWGNTVGIDWTDSEDKTVLVAERADISNTQNVSITYNTLPEGRYKVEYYVSGHNSISSSSIRVADTNITVKDKNGEHIINSVKPAASTIGYIDLGVYDFGESGPDNYIKAVPNVDGYVPDLFLSYAVRLTPVGNDALVKLYAETGCTNLAEYVNDAADKQEALVNAENYGYEIDNASLKDMTSVYAAIAKKTFTSDYEVIAEFNKAVSDKLKTVEYSAQAGKILYTDSRYFYREKINMQAGRFGFLMYEGIAHPELIKSVKAKPVATNNYDTIIDKYSQSIIETETWGDITGDELTKVISYESDMTEFDHQYAVRSSRVELPKEIISMNGQTALRFKTDRDTQVEYSDIALYVTYDNSTGAFDEPLVVTEYYTIDKVSFVNAVDGKEETAQIGYVGSAYVTKNDNDVPDAVLVAASYTADGKLDVLKTVPLSNLTTGESTKVGINLNTVKNPGSVKIFVWSGISGMTPYASLFTVNSPTNTDVGYASAWYLPDGTFEYVPKN